MIILEHISFEFLQLLRTERTPMVPVYSLLNTAFAEHMSASSDIRIINWICADVALKL